MSSAKVTPLTFTKVREFYIKQAVQRLHSRIEWWNTNINTYLRLQDYSTTNLKYLPCFGGDCVLTAAHTINKMPLVPLNNVTPHEKLHVEKPSYDMMRVFRCLCFTSTLRRDRRKQDEKANPCVFIGYSKNKKGYKVYNLKTKCVLVSRDATFYEKCFPYRFESINKTLQENLFTPKKNLTENSTNINISNEVTAPTQIQNYDD